MTARQLPKYIVAGEVRNEFIIDLNGKANNNQLGGSCIYAAASINHWDSPVGIIGVIGQDFPPELIRILIEKKINTQGLRVLPESLDLRSFIAYPSNSTPSRGNPVAVYSSKGLPFPRELLGFSVEDGRPLQKKSAAFSHMLTESLPSDYTAAIGAHISPLDFTCQLQLTTLMQMGSVRTITLQPHPSCMKATNWNDITVLVKDLSAFITPENDLRIFFQNRSEDIWEMMNTICGYGCHHVVVNLNAGGFYLFDSLLSKRYHIPDYPGNQIDPTGRLDTFSGAFLVEYLSSHNALEAATLGCVAASLNSEASGPFSIDHSLPGLDNARKNVVMNMITRY